MSKFKVGDTVRAIEEDMFHEWHIGDIMQVVCGVKEYAGLPCVGNERYINHEANVEEFELVESAAPAIDAHYTKYAIQPMEFSLANGLDAAQHTVIKYTVRYRDKGGIRDLRAAIRVLELMIEREEKAKANG